MYERLDNIEIHCGYLQKSLDELSAVVLEQQQEIRQLQRELLRFAEKFEAFILAETVPADDKPPHY